MLLRGFRNVTDELVEVPARRGFALRDAVDASQSHSGTYLGKALAEIREMYDRIIVITDEHAHDRVPGPRGRGYVINSSNRNSNGMFRLRLPSAFTADARR